MQRTIIEQTDRFMFVSIGNGAAYTLTDKKSGEVKMLQYGDDANAWRDYYDNMQEAYANPDSVWHDQPWDNCLAQLFEDA